LQRIYPSAPPRCTRAFAKTKCELYRHLRQCHRKRRKAYGKAYNTRGQIPNRIDISERPAHIELRQELGHWEADTVIGANHKHAIVTLNERKTGFTLIAKVERKTAELVRQACIHLLTPFKDCVHSITFDNGKEFAEHQLIAQSINCNTYFAKPYCSWQRGSNENTNGLIRQYIPKKSSLAGISEHFLDTIMHKLNNRPRKRHGFIAPAVLFNQIALRT
jgi:transposase, IS30 family